MTDIIIAHGICSPIRPKVTATLDPYGVQYTINAWTEDEAGTNPGPDSDSMAWRHVAVVRVNPQAAKWAEYLLCRYMAANPGVGMRLLSTPLDARNQRWAAKWDKLPRAWKQEGCNAVPAKRAARTPAKRTRRTQPAAPPRLGIIGRLLRRR